MLSVIKANILNYIRKRNIALFNILFPLLLIVVLGFTLISKFEIISDYSINQIKAIYIVDSNDTKEAVKTINELESEFNIQLINEDDILSKEKVLTPSSLDYYGIAVIGVFILYSFFIPSHFMKEEINIKNRMLFSGVSSKQYYFAAIISYSIIGFISTSLVYLIAKFILGINYGENIFILPIVALPFIILVMTLGALYTLVFKYKDRKYTILCFTVITILCFLGGGYIPLTYNGNKVLNFLTAISPLKWFNTSLLKYIYNTDNTVLITCIIVSYISIIILISAIYYLFGKEGSLNGECMDFI